MSFDIVILAIKHAIVSVRQPRGTTHIATIIWCSARRHIEHAHMLTRSLEPTIFNSPNTHPAIPKCGEQRNEAIARFWIVSLWYPYVCMSLVGRWNVWNLNIVSEIDNKHRQMHYFIIFLYVTVWSLYRWHLLLPWSWIFDSTFIEWR